MKTFLITTNDANQRLDKFLKKLLPNASLTLIYKLNRKNCVKVDGKRRDNEYRLIEGEEVKLFVNDIDFAKMSEQIVEKIVSPSGNLLKKSDIVYEDADLLIVNKEPGILVHPGDFKTKELSLIAMVQDYLGNKLNSLTFKPSLVHRIDRDTSGVVLIAKTKPALDSMLSALQNNRIEKKYIAICQGIFEKKRDTVRAKLERLENAKNENKVRVSDSGQSAVTHYRVLHEDVERGFSVVECHIETGRMHQIRVHMAHLGHPVLGDDTYGDKKLNGYLRKNERIDRQMLHAYKISFNHPTKKIPVTFMARLKEDMAIFLKWAPVEKWYGKN